MQIIDLTDEDYEIVARVMDCVTDEQYALADRADASVMVAIEVAKERAWRISGVRAKPADLVSAGLRQTIERENAEPLP